MTLRQPIFATGGPSPPTSRPIRQVAFASGSKTIAADDGIIEADTSGGTFQLIYDPTIFDPGQFPPVTVTKTTDDGNQALIVDQDGTILATLNDLDQSYDLTSLGSTTLVS